jgi:hypothetical protein
MRFLRIYYSHNYLPKEDKMGRACSKHTKFWSENLKGRDHVEDVDIDRRIILQWILGK